MKKLILSFGHALCGIVFCVKTCRNFRIHLTAAAYMLYFSRFYDYGAAEDCILFVLIALVLCAEGMNCALEQTCNAVTLNDNSFIKHAKDAAAGAVLICAFSAAAIGLRLYFQIPVLFEIYQYFVSSPLRLILLLLSAAVSVLFIFYKDIFKNGTKTN